MAEMAENTYVFSGSEEELDRLLTCIKNTPSIFKELDEQILDYYHVKGKVTVITESKWDNRPTQWKAFLKKNGLEMLKYGWQSIEPTSDYFVRYDPFNLVREECNYNVMIPEEQLVVSKPLSRTQHELRSLITRVLLNMDFELFAKSSLVTMFGQDFGITKDTPDCENLIVEKLRELDLQVIDCEYIADEQPKTIKEPPSC